MNTATTGHERTNGRWVSLSVASRLLGMNKATLRQWGDRGAIRTFRTPGGHRRFSRQDLLRLVGEPAPRAFDGAVATLGSAALQKVRRRLRYARAEVGLWQSRLDEEGRDHLRALGRRLLELASRSAAEPHSRRGLLAEARAIGEEQGQAMAERGVPLEEATQIYLFCRNSFLDTLAQAWGQEEVPGSELARLWKQASAFMDEVLVAMVTGHKKVARSLAEEGSL